MAVLHFHIPVIKLTSFNCLFILMLVKIVVIERGTFQILGQMVYLLAYYAE